MDHTRACHICGGVWYTVTQRLHSHFLNKLYLFSFLRVGFFTAAVCVWCVPALRVLLVHSLINHFRQKGLHINFTHKKRSCGLRSTGGPELLKWGLPGGGVKSAKAAPTSHVYYPPENGSRNSEGEIY